MLATNLRKQFVRQKKVNYQQNRAIWVETRYSRKEWYSQNRNRIVPNKMEITIGNTTQRRTF